MKGRPTDKLVYEQMFPKPKTNDPQSFPTFLTRNLIPEVRQETQAFYGHLDTQEAKYPGLDYNHPTHRIRLSRWPWHRRLFRAFDALGLTEAEISGLTRWEGTKWAKEKYESEQGIVIRDTTADDIPDWDEKLDGIIKPFASRRVASSDIEHDDDVVRDDNMNEDDLEDQSEEEQLESVGIALNERLRAGAARREAGDTSAVLDEEWEQWLKSAIESGVLHEDMSEQNFRHMLESTIVPAGLIPAAMVSAARAGEWRDIPEFLHPLLRRTLQSETASGSLARRDWATRRTYSDLRLPVGGRGTNITGL